MLDNHSDPMPAAKRPTNPTWEHIRTRAGVEMWERRHLLVLSECSSMEAPDGSGDSLPTWLVSVSVQPYGRRIPTDAEMDRVRHDFGVQDAEEDNHESGLARKLFLVVDPERRVDCECKADECVVVRRDGYRYSVPALRARPAMMALAIAATDGGDR